MKPELNAQRLQSCQTSTRRMSNPGARRTWTMVSLFAFSSLGASACFLDFDEFEKSDALLSDAGEDTDTNDADDGQSDGDAVDVPSGDGDDADDVDDTPTDTVIGATR